MRNPSLIRAPARYFLAGEATAEQIAARASRTLGREWRWLRPLARRYLNDVVGRTRPRHRDVVQFFLKDHRFGRAWAKHFDELSVAQWLSEPDQMQPVAAALYVAERPANRICPLRSTNGVEEVTPGNPLLGDSQSDRILSINSVHYG